VAAVALLCAPAAGAGVYVYASSQTLPPSGRLPQSSMPSVTINAPPGEREGAWVVVTRAQDVGAALDRDALGSLRATISFGHFVSFGGRMVPDALLPWDGADRPVERPNQPLYLQVVVPPDARPGGYRATVTVTANGRPTQVPVAITVFPV